MSLLIKRVGIPKALLTQAGQIVYASGPGTPAVIDPPSSQKYLRHPGGSNAPTWADLG